jgi:cholesterol oxidase
VSDFDVIVIGSGFGGSVSALRLAEKGHRVLVIEKGKRWGVGDFPESNWDLKRWMWMPQVGLRGFFQMSFLKHVTVLHGVGVGGGSLVYANTLPVPKDDFFEAASWAMLAPWKRELSAHYETARRMLGAARNPRTERGDEVLREIARDLGREEHFHPTDVAVFFGKPGVRVPDPYFGGDGPERTGCIFCGACMTGCRVGAKNTLDYNYLYLAEKRGALVRAETEVVAVRPSREHGWRVEMHGRLGDEAITARRVIFAGGVMGTVPLLLAMKEDPDGLPALSDRVGDAVRTNSEALCGVIVPDRDADFSRGVAITSILHTDEHSHIEPVRYSAGSGFFRTMILPQTRGASALGRAASAVRSLAAHPVRWARAYAVADFAKQSQILLYMRTLEGTLRMRLGRDVRTGFRRGLVTILDDPTQAPRSDMPEALDLANRFAEKVGGVAATLLTETVLGVPSTAHILGGACMGADIESGVIDDRHRVFGHDGLFVVDGSAVSANPGVNPSLTITALAERAMSHIPAKG